MASSSTLLNLTELHVNTNRPLDPDLYSCQMTLSDGMISMKNLAGMQVYILIRDIAPSIIKGASLKDFDKYKLDVMASGLKAGDVLKNLFAEEVAFPIQISRQKSNHGRPKQPVCCLL